MSLPVLPIALGLGVLALVATSKKSSAAPPPPIGTPPATLPPGVVPPTTSVIPSTPAPSETTESKTSITGATSGKTWLVASLGGGNYDVYAPEGSWGPHAELRVLRFQQNAATGNQRLLTAIVPNAPGEIVSAAMIDLQIAAPAPTVITPPGRPPMPLSLQQEMAAVMAELGVDSQGVVRGPVTAEAVRYATDLSSRLEQVGYPEAAATMRSYAQQGAKMIPTPPPAAQPPAIPGLPKEVTDAIARAIELERAPEKLEALAAALKTYPPSAERDHLLAILQALIVQVKTAQAVANAATDVEQYVKSPGQPTGSPPAPTPLPSTPLPTVTLLGTRVLKLGTSGPDVAEWQAILGQKGYAVGTIDGLFGSNTDAATRAFQKDRGLTVDGAVGPNTIAASRGANAAAPSTPVIVLPSSARVLSKGMNGADVAAWQGVLKASGYAVTVDGQFGPATEAATMDWQSRHGLPADGKVGPQTLSRVGTPPDAPLMVPSSPVPQPLPVAKSPREIAAEAAAIHLIELQRKYGVKASKGKEDLGIVKRFQKEAGLSQDGKAGPGTLVAIAQSGQGTLPKVMYWPSAGTKAKDLPKYRNDLEAVARAAELNGYATLAAQIRASAAAEQGEAGLA